MKKLLLVALSTFAVSAHAWEPTYYAGSSLATWQHSESNNNVVDTDFSFQSLEAVAGATLTPFTSVEVRGGLGLTTSHKTSDDGSEYAERAMPYFGSLYFKPHLTNEKASLYGLLGVTSVTIDKRDGRGAATREESTTAASFGVGVSFVMHPKVDLTAEWKKLINADEFDISGGSLGFVYRF